MTNPAPILVFTYKRFDTLKRAIASLQENQLAAESELFIFSDAAKFEKDIEQVAKIRTYIKTITGFKKVYVTEAAKNKGLAKSILEGVTQIIELYDRVIVLEDDLVTSKNFLSFMNQALDYYKDHKKVFSIAGFSTVKGLNSNGVFFTQRSSSWGWATWKDRWDQVDWEVKDYAGFSKDKLARKKFNRIGSDLPVMLDRQMQNKINSWAIRWVYHQFRKDLYSVHPASSKVINIGFSSDATHTKERFSRFKTELDTSGDATFNFSDDIRLEDQVLKQFARPYSIAERIKYKIINTLFSF